jgi:hypothetical protein
MKIVRLYLIVVLFDTVQEVDIKFLIRGLIILTFNQAKQIKQLQSKTGGFNKTTMGYTSRISNTTAFNKNNTIDKDLKIKALEEEIKRLKLNPLKQSGISPIRPKTGATNLTTTKSFNKSLITPTAPKHKRSSSVTIESKFDLKKK